MTPTVTYTHNTNIVFYLLMAQTKRSPFWYVMIHLLVIKASRECFSQIKASRNHKISFYILSIVHINLIQGMSVPGIWSFEIIKVILAVSLLQ